MANLGKSYWEATKCIMRHMKGIKETCIYFGRGDLLVLGYIDLDFVRHVDTMRSTSSYVFTFGGGAVSWMSCS